MRVLADATPAALLLPAVPEPVRLKGGLRRLVGDDPSAAPAEISRRLARSLWRAWHRELVASGVTARLLHDQLSALSYETWLWVMGDRPFEQLASALAGRLERRLPGTVRGPS